MNKASELSLDRLTNSLDPVHDLPKVIAIRQHDLAYAAFRRLAVSIFSGRRCIVIGSSPHFVPPLRQEGDVIFTVNGSAFQLGKLGLTESDVTLVNGAVFPYAFDGLGTPEFQEVSKATIKVLSTARSEHCFVASNTYPFTDSVRMLESIGYRSRHMHDLRGLERAALVGEACGAELGFGGLQERVSNGVVAICMALWGGAREVVFAGFSLAGGHCYIPAATPRQHTRGDRSFFQLSGGGSMPVSTTDEELVAQFGIRRARKGTLA